MLKRSIPIEVIEDITGLNKEEIQKIKEKNN